MHINSLFRLSNNISGHLLKNLVFRMVKILAATRTEYRIRINLGSHMYQIFRASQTSKNSAER